MSHSNPHQEPASLQGQPNFDPAPACGAADLKGLLNTIVEQLSDADRRHSETLNQMQDRLAGIGREAQSLRERVPNQFAAAVDRIEAGMTELSTRIAETSLSRPAEQDALPSTQTYLDEPAAKPQQPASHLMTGNSPVALRSAADPKHSGAGARIPAGVDPFDVIESSIPGSVTDPWDGEAAEALAGLYESGSAFAKHPEPFEQQSLAPIGDHAAPAPMSGAAGGAGVDHFWLEARFAEIATCIERSIADIRPDHGFFALGQRLDHFEQTFGKLAENAAIHHDVDSIRQIQTHIADVAKYLEHTHDQLLRLDAIEAQLNVIGTRLDDVHQIATRELDAPASISEGGFALPDFDVQKVVRAAAHETALRFSELQPKSAEDRDGHELRPLLERIMTESRQSDENTAALLDTLQQAMIRLLDRVDAIELTQHSAAPTTPHAKAHYEVAPPSPSLPEIEAAILAAEKYDPRYAVNDTPDLAEAGVPNGRPMSPAYGPAAAAAAPASVAAAGQPVAVQGEPPRANGKGRPDLVAEARRARMRLAGDDNRDESAIQKPAGSSAEALKEIGRKSQSAAPAIAAKAVAAAGKSSGPSAPSPRLMGLAALMVAALGGLWYTLDSRALPPLPVNLPHATTPMPQGGTLPADPALELRQSDQGSLPPATGDAPLPSEGAAPQSNPGQRGDLDLKNGTEGEVLPGNLTVGSTTVPMLGVAVDTDTDVTAEEFAQKRRNQLMADISSKLGATATKSARELMSPASLTPQVNETEPSAEPGATSVQKNSLTRAAPLDLPPATVGPLSLRLAAANGDPSAEFEVGSRLAEGKGTSQNFAEAAKWYQRAASRGFPQAQYRLGTLYERGLGVKADPARAESWYTRAAEQGNIKAMHNLAVLSANQKKGAPDYVTAARWFREAAERGLSDSQFNLAVLYENGLGIEQNLKQAFVWLSIAARGGDSDAIRRRDILRGKLSAPDLAEAETMLKTWQAKVADKGANDSRSAGEAWKKNSG